MKEQTTNRRDFLRKGLLAAAATTAPLVMRAEGAKETVKMLTPDGQLVEVDKEVVAKASKKKVGNKEILEWRKGPE